MNSNRNNILRLLAVVVGASMLTGWVSCPYLNAPDMFSAYVTSSSLSHETSVLGFVSFCSQWGTINGSGTASGAAIGLRIASYLMAFFWAVGLVSMVVLLARSFASKSNINAFAYFIWPLVSAIMVAVLAAFSDFLVSANSPMGSMIAPTIWIGVTALLCIGGFFVREKR